VPKNKPSAGFGIEKKAAPQGREIVAGLKLLNESVAPYPRCNATIAEDLPRSPEAFKVRQERLGGISTRPRV
jgi:hypothetical protein